MKQQPGQRNEVRDFLMSRRARIRPDQAGLPMSGRRRVAGLRREEVAVLAGVSTEWYIRLERGHIRGVSEEVLGAVARALQLDDDERSYLFELARSSRPVRGGVPSRRRQVDVPPRVQWLLDSMTGSSAFVRTGRTEVIAANALARALHAPMFTSPTVDSRGRPNIARYVFLDPGARDFFVDWEPAGSATAAMLRAEAGRDPGDPALRELVGELSTLSPDFRRRWADHDVLMRHDGVKRLRHPEVGELELTFQSLDLPLTRGVVHDLVVYSAAPGTASEDRLRLLASWAATAELSPS
ncbi:MAG: helix-turn-helix domain-containing protein [Actinomycetales bacterium]